MKSRTLPLVMPGREPGMTRGGTSCYRVTVTVAFMLLWRLQK
jgi:hypothetical protein